MNFLSDYRPHFKANIRLATPIIIGQVGQIVVNIADNVMVGRLGAAELASVSLANALFISIIVIGMGISFALPPLVAEAQGQKADRLISSYTKHSLVLNFLFAFIAIPLIELAIPLMSYWGQEPQVVELAGQYLRISAYTLVPFMLFQTFRCYADGSSETVPAMVAMLVGNVINIFCNYMFIYGKWGAPALGVEGAALGTLISRVGMLFLLLFIIYKRKHLWKHLQAMDLRTYQSKEFKKLLNLGIPTSLQGFFEISAFGGAAVLAGMISKEVQAAHQIAINLASISFLVCTGLAMAATIRVGNQFGKSNREPLRHAGFSAIMQVAFFMACTAILYIVLREFLPSLYVDNKEVIQIAAALLVWAAIFQIPDGIQVTAIGALRGMQDVRRPTVITFVAYWLFALPVSYFLAFNAGLGAVGIWIGLTIGLTISAFFMVWRFAKISQNA